MRLLLAARLSRKYHGQTGIETQDQRSREAAEREGHQVIAVAADRKSGTVAPWDRPSLRPWVTKPELMTRYDGIIAYKNDRLSRGAWADEVRIRLWAEENGKVLIIAGGPQWPPRHEGDRWSWEAMASQARREWEEIRERSVRSQKILRENHYLVGRPPFGYVIVPLDDHKTLAPDPRIAPVLAEVARRYLAGATLTALCEYLELEGVKPAQAERWNQTSLRRVLENPSLKGRRKNAKGQTELRFPGILDDNTWARLQVRLEAAREKPLRGAVSDDPALLTRIIRCAKCGGPMHFKRTYNVRRDGTKIYKYHYRCDGSKRDWSKCRNMIPAAMADEAVSSWVAGVIGGCELIARVVVPGHGYDDEIRELDAEIRAVDLDDPLWQEKTSALRDRRAELKELKPVPADVMEKPTGIKVRDHWDSLDTTAARRAFLQAGQVKLLASLHPFRFSVEAYMGEWTV
jgi:DNA invertase Pin-like site-specific DNA recombinase